MRTQDLWNGQFRANFCDVCAYLHFDEDNQNAFALELDSRSDKDELTFSQLIDVANTWSKRPQHPHLPLGRRM